MPLVRIAGDWSFGFGRAQYVTGELAVPQQ
jgi:hypothetical protein